VNAPVEKGSRDAERVGMQSRLYSRVRRDVVAERGPSVTVYLSGRLVVKSNSVRRRTLVTL